MGYEGYTPQNAQLLALQEFSRRPEINRPQGYREHHWRYWVIDALQVPVEAYAQTGLTIYDTVAGALATTSGFHHEYQSALYMAYQRAEQEEGLVGVLKLTWRLAVSAVTRGAPEIEQAYRHGQSTGDWTQFRAALGDAFNPLNFLRRRPVQRELPFQQGPSRRTTELAPPQSVPAPVSNSHHVVSRYGNTGRGWQRNWTQEAQGILDRAGVRVESGANRVTLPGHEGPHPELYHQRVYERLSEAERNRTGQARTDAVRHELQRIADDLLADPTRLTGVWL